MCRPLSAGMRTGIYDSRATRPLVTRAGDPYTPPARQLRRPHAAMGCGAHAETVRHAVTRQADPLAHTWDERRPGFRRAFSHVPVHRPRGGGEVSDLGTV